MPARMPVGRSAAYELAGHGAGMVVKLSVQAELRVTLGGGRLDERQRERPVRDLLVVGLRARRRADGSVGPRVARRVERRPRRVHGVAQLDHEDADVAQAPGRQHVDVLRTDGAATPRVAGREVRHLADVPARRAVVAVSPPIRDLVLEFGDGRASGSIGRDELVRAGLPTDQQHHLVRRRLVVPRVGEQPSGVTVGDRELEVVEADAGRAHVDFDAEVRADERRGRRDLQLHRQRRDRNEIPPAQPRARWPR